MLKRDFIMVQIEELGKVIAQIAHQRATNAARNNPGLIQGVYNSLKIEPAFLLQASAQDICRHLNGDDLCGLQRMEIAAKLMIEEAQLYPERQDELLLKAIELLTYVQANDHTFSLERLMLLERCGNGLGAALAVDSGGDDATGISGSLPTGI
jgi:hypothetical protein